MKTDRNTQGKSQKQMILNAMLAGKKLTSLDGVKMFGSIALRNRVSEIIMEGKHKVTKSWKRTKTGKNVRVYSIEI